MRSGPIQRVPVISDHPGVFATNECAVVLPIGVLVALISGIETVYYRIANMNRAVAFYQDVLGLPLKNRAANDWAEFDVGNGEMALEGELATAPHQGGATVVFKSDDLHALAAKLKDNSVKMGEVEDLGGSLLLEFYDPDGNRLIAMQALGTS